MSMKEITRIQLTKYPKTPHLPCSEGVQKDDTQLKDYSNFIGKTISITEKMDGENISIYKDYWHCRSIDSVHKQYHSYLQNKILPQIQPLLKDNQKIIGEYLYAEHSIHYNNLLSYFQVFAMIQDNYVLGQSLTRQLCDKYGLVHVPFLGIIQNFQLKDVKQLKEIANTVIEKGGEGIVIRNNDFFYLEDFSKNVAKYVRKNYIQTDEHWSSHIYKNGLLSNSSESI